MTRCKECPLFNSGTCRLSGCEAEEEDKCLYEYMKHMNLSKKEAEIVLHYSQKWRRGASIQMISPCLFGKAIDTAIRTLRKHKDNETHHSTESRR